MAYHFIVRVCECLWGNSPTNEEIEYMYARSCLCVLWFYHVLCIKACTYMQIWVGINFYLCTCTYVRTFYRVFIGWERSDSVVPWRNLISLRKQLSNTSIGLRSPPCMWWSWVVLPPVVLSGTYHQLHWFCNHGSQLLTAFRVFYNKFVWWYFIH